MASVGLLAVAACHDGILGTRDSEFRLQLDVRSVSQDVASVLDLVELTTREGSDLQLDSLSWGAVEQGTPFTVHLKKAGKVRFDASALAGTTRPEGGVTLLRGSTEAVVEDGFKVYIYLDDLTPDIVISPGQDPTACSADLNLVMRRYASVKICNPGAGILTWKGGGQRVVGPQVDSCPPGDNLCIALDPAGGEIPPGGEALVQLRSIGDGPGVVPVEFQEIFQGLLLRTDTALVTVEASAITIQIETSPSGTREPLGPPIETGTGLTVSYRISNTGVLPFEGVVVTEEDTLSTTQDADTVFELAGLQPGAVFDTTLIRPVLGGKQQRKTTAQGAFDNGEVVRDSVIGYYVGLVPGIGLETLTNGVDDGTFPGPSIPAGSDVEIEYHIRNVGQVPLSRLTLTDGNDAAVEAACVGGGLPPLLAVGDSVVCTLGMVAEPGQFAQRYRVMGITPAGQLVTAARTSHHVGSGPPIALTVRTNGVRADQPPGPSITIGSPVTWSYTVVNDGSQAAANLVVTDSRQGAVCSVTSLDAGSTLTCEKKGIAQSGQYSSVATATAQTPDGSYSASQSTYYLGVGAARIHVEMLTRGLDADDPPGPDIVVGGAVDWEYRVTNPGSVTLSNVRVMDSQLGSVCAMGSGSTLAPGQTYTCQAAGSATLGPYEAVATAEGTASGTVVRDTDPSHYTGVPETVTDSVSIEKATNGQDADQPMGPAITPGATVTWTYVVTNQGTTSLTGLVVADDKLGQICSREFLAAGASFTCEATGIAVAGQYENLGTVTALGAKGVVGDSDPSHYVGH